MVTQHAQVRIRKRAGIPRSGANRLARKAYLHGITHSQTRGKLRAYCDRLYFAQHTANNLRIYGHFIYLFCGEILMTMWELPKRLQPLADKIRKEME
jgi:hypothetical protein